MKRILLSVLFYLLAVQLFAQTEGISYQAVIIGSDKQELPGEDAQGNILPNADIAIRFTIINGANAVVYQEIQKTHTDQFGRINLLIGSAGPDKFTQIDWDGTAKDLKVEIDFKGGTSFVDMSREALTFLPFAYHRNITARGTLIVNGTSDLNGELKVQGPTNLYSTLNVKDSNATNLSGSLTVEGPTNLNNGVKVKGTTSIDSIYVSKSLIVDGDAVFNGTATFKSDGEPTTFAAIAIDSLASLKGGAEVSVLSAQPADQSVFEDYPLRVSGSEQGIAIKVNGKRTNANNFISFWDEDEGRMWGRIEGQTKRELNLDYQYERGRVKNVLDFAKAVTTALIATLDVFQAGFKVVAASTSATACVGLGACVTVPIPSLIIESVSNTALRIANAALILYDLASTLENGINYEISAHKNIGVTYSSGAGDYAEWLPKQNPSEIFAAGQLVGIKNGHVTSHTWGVEKIMIVSTRPIVLGNMPQHNDEKNNVKIAFMGQVPVKVLGKVSPGDYILPNVLGNGFATAVHPKDMKTKDYKKVAGVAWNTIEEITKGLSTVNVAVGINTNDLSDIVSKQEDELLKLKKNYDQLNTRLQQSNKVLANLIPGYADALGLKETNAIANISAENNSIGKVKQPQTFDDSQILKHDDEDVIYFQISDEQIAAGLAMARELYVQMNNDSKLISKLSGSNQKLMGSNSSKLKKGFEDMVLMPIKDHPFWQRMDSDPSYKKEIIDLIQDKIENAYHTHKKYVQNFTGLKVRK